MRSPALLPLVLLTAGCWSPGPGRPDPTRYPWDVRNQPSPQPPVAAQGGIAPLPQAEPQPLPEGQAAIVALPSVQPAPPQPGTYCIVALTPPGTTGIVFSGKLAPNPACPVPAQGTGTFVPQPS
jgi:hypothetical protein